jgi:hypothetical protein
LRGSRNIKEFFLRRSAHLGRRRNHLWWRRLPLRGRHGVQEDKFAWVNLFAAYCWIILLPLRIRLVRLKGGVRRVSAVEGFVVFVTEVNWFNPIGHQICKFIFVNFDHVDLASICRLMTIHLPASTKDEAITFSEVATEAHIEKFHRRIKRVRIDGYNRDAGGN